MKKHALHIAALCCLLLAGMCNGLMDALQFHEGWKCFDNALFWNPDISWMNKWAMSAEGVPIVGKERFWGSSTFFVAFTDGWHLAKFGWLLFVKLAVVLAVVAPPFAYLQKWGWLVQTLGIFAVATVAHSLGFHLVYSLIF